MQLIQLETKIAAPPERCFLLSLNIDLHKESTAQTSERAIAGVTHGLIGPNETVTWQARHFGLMLTHETLISKYDRPHHFQDIMLRGMFKSFEHDHFFHPLPGGTTLMRDELRFAAPLGPLGHLAETLVLRRYLTGFLVERNNLIKAVAESPKSRWLPYTLTPS
jgi:ligand-binding SRPBCC domain-containing protein